MAGDTIDGYLGGETYPSGFHRQFTPQWIDAMVRRHGVAPPRGGDRAPFTLLDLGCGDGLALVALAAAHPEGRFVGVDALPDHVRRGTASAAYAGLSNVAFFCGRFADLDDPIEPAFDYVTAQGVLSWVSPENRAHVRRLCAINLKPGGIACIGYNAMPGWRGGLATQQMLFLLSEEKEGSGVQRFAAALEQVHALAAAGSPGIDAKFLAWLDDLRGTMSSHYFPHEYLNRDWQPLWSGREHAAMAQHGLTFVGTSRAEMLRADFVLRAEQRQALAAIAGDHARETALDVMVDQTFRTDLFGRDAVCSGRTAAQAEGWWASTTDPADAEYALVTPAGMIAFDDPAARSVLAALAKGPCHVADMAVPGSAGEAGLVDALDALWMSGQILPCDPPLADAAAGSTFNRLNTAAARAGAPLPALVGRHGAMPVAHATIVAAANGDAEACAGVARLGIDPGSLSAAD